MTQSTAAAEEIAQEALLGLYRRCETWHHPRIRFVGSAPVEDRHRDGVASPLDIDGVPAVLVVGADDVILGRFGFQDVAAELAGLGLTPPAAGPHG